MVILNLKGVGKCEDYLLQLNLLGLHGVLKNFAEFNATILDNSGNQAKQQPKTNQTPWIKRVRQFYAHFTC